MRRVRNCPSHEPPQVTGCQVRSSNAAEKRFYSSVTSSSFLETKSCQRSTGFLTEPVHLSIWLKSHYFWKTKLEILLSNSIPLIWAGTKLMVEHILFFLLALWKKWIGCYCCKVHNFCVISKPKITISPFLGNFLEKLLVWR